MTRLQLARLVRFTLNPSQEELPDAYYVVDNKAVEPVYRPYNLLQLRQFSKERLVGMIVDYLLSEDTEGKPLSVFYKLAVAEKLLANESEVILLCISRWVHFATEYETLPAWAALAYKGDLPGSIARIRTELRSPNYDAVFQDYKMSREYLSMFWGEKLS